MLSHFKNDLLYIDTIDKAGRWQVSLFGYKPPALSAKSASYSCINIVAWKADQFAIDEYEGKSNYEMAADNNARPSVSVSPKRYTIYTVDLSGMNNSTSCSVYRDRWLQICVIDDDRQYGEACGNASKQNGIVIEDFNLFAADTELDQIAQGGDWSWVFSTLEPGPPSDEGITEAPGSKIRH
jgi:hypothetical protein